MSKSDAKISGQTAVQPSRDSFSRFDSQLLETILSFLTFSEKVFFESLSKQIKSSIYRQQKHLSLHRGPADGHNSLNKLLEPIEVVDMITGIAVNHNLKGVNKVWLKSVLKKCKSIEILCLDCFLDFEVLDIIGDNCPNMKSIRFDATGLNANDLDGFGQKCGHLITSLQIYSVWPYIPRFYSESLLKHCYNLKRFRCPRICELIREDSQYLPELESVDDFCLGHLTDEECDEPDNCKVTSTFNIFCDKYSEKLKRFNVLSYNAFNHAQLNTFLTNICKFTNLIELELDFDTDEDIDYSINDYLIEISKRNPDLKCFKLSLYTEWIKMEELFFAFDGFKSLVELKIGVIYYNDIKPIKGSVQCFKSLEGLKSFEICYKHIREEFFDDIDRHLPQLSTLVIECESEITDKTITQFSRLKKLKSFSLKKFSHLNSNQFITDQSICAVLNGCPLLENMRFFSRLNITDKTIETLISCANSRPKIRLSFEVFSTDLQPIDEEVIQAIDLNAFIDKIPHNLKITIN